MMMDSSVENMVTNQVVTQTSVISNGHNDVIELTSYKLIAKWGKEKIVLEGLKIHDTIGTVKDRLTEQTRVLQKRQKLIGLVAAKGGSKAVSDNTILGELKVKGTKKSSDNENETQNVIVHEFILMGTPEHEIFIDPSDKDDLPDVIDDFDLDFNAGSSEWLQHVANGENLKKFTESTTVHIMNPSREGKPLLVLDLDHTLLDFSRKSIEMDSTGGVAASMMKRPFMDDFLTEVYKYYDLVVWSQTSWRWLETKLIELGMISNPGYNFVFVLDKTSMFTVKSTKRGGQSYVHHVKPLQLIWTKFPQWGSHNTVHLDDLSRNFALNLESGLRVAPYHRKKSSSRRDTELLGLKKYLARLAQSKISFDEVRFEFWQDVVSGNRNLSDKD